MGETERNGGGDEELVRLIEAMVADRPAVLALRRDQRIDGPVAGGRRILIGAVALTLSVAVAIVAVGARRSGVAQPPVPAVVRPVPVPRSPLAAFLAIAPSEPAARPPARPSRNRIAARRSSPKRDASDAAHGSAGASVVDQPPIDEPLRRALIEDARRTRELNQAQLDGMAPPR